MLIKVQCISKNRKLLAVDRRMRYSKSRCSQCCFRRVVQTIYNFQLYRNKQFFYLRLKRPNLYALSLIHVKPIPSAQPTEQQEVRTCLCPTNSFVASQRPACPVYTSLTVTHERCSKEGSQEREENVATVQSSRSTPVLPQSDRPEKNARTYCIERFRYLRSFSETHRYLSAINMCIQKSIVNGRLAPPPGVDRVSLPSSLDNVPYAQEASNSGNIESLKTLIEPSSSSSPLSASTI